MGKGQQCQDLREKSSGRLREKKEQVQRPAGRNQSGGREGCAQWASGEAVGGKVRDAGTHKLL